MADSTSAEKAGSGGKLIDASERFAARGARFAQEVDSLTTPDDLHAKLEASINHPAVNPQEVDRDLEAIEKMAGNQLDPEILADEIKGFFLTLAGINQKGIEMKITWPDDGGVTDLNEAIRGILERARKPK
ncbi:MAG: hypothetical protein ABSE17_03520 [Candidatus Levyibacteriota bacterium]|jgi:hypothetical protein